MVILQGQRNGTRKLQVHRPTQRDDQIGRPTLHHNAHYRSHRPSEHQAFNASTTVIKYRLEYSIDGGTTWTIAKTVNGQETADISVYTITQATWNLDIKKSDSALFRITHIAGNKSAYIDDFSLYAPAKDFATGDVNGDGEVNVADVNALIDIIMSGSTDADTMSRADVNNDGEVNVADINAIIDIILS